MSAATRALGTIEILEQVLLGVPMWDLLRAQRVSRVWRACIRDSSSLQRKLFLLPCPPSADDLEEGIICDWCPGSVSALRVQSNPLLENVFHIRLSRDLPSTLALCADGALNQVPKTQDLSTEMRLTWTWGGAGGPFPMCQTLRTVPNIDFRTQTTCRDYTACSAACLEDPSSCAHVRIPETRGLDHYVSGNWTQMLACQPPLPSLTLRTVPSAGPEWTAKVTARDGLAVTLGDLVHAAAELFRLLPPRLRFSGDKAMRIHQHIILDEEAADRMCSDQVFSNMYANNWEGRRPFDRTHSRFEVPWATLLRCEVAR